MSSIRIVFTALADCLGETTSPGLKATDYRARTREIPETRRPLEITRHSLALLPSAAWDVKDMG